MEWVRLGLGLSAGEGQVARQRSRRVLGSQRCGRGLQAQRKGSLHCPGPRGGNREAGGEEGGTAPSRPPQPAPSPACPPPRGCPPSPSAYAFPRWVPAELGATRLSVRLLASQGFPHPFWRPVLLEGASSIVLSLGWALPDPMSLPPPLP